MGDQIINIACTNEMLHQTNPARDFPTRFHIRTDNDTTITTKTAPRKPGCPNQPRFTTQKSEIRKMHQNFAPTKIKKKCVPSTNNSLKYVKINGPMMSTRPSRTNPGWLESTPMRGPVCLETLAFRTENRKCENPTHDNEPCMNSIFLQIVSWTLRLCGHESLMP